MKKKVVAKRDVSNKVVLEAILSLGDRVSDIEKNMATKDYVKVVAEDIKEDFHKEFRNEIRPLMQAVDKDAVTIVNHEKRITKLETNLARR